MCGVPACLRRSICISLPRYAVYVCVCVRAYVHVREEEQPCLSQDEVPTLGHNRCGRAGLPDRELIAEGRCPQQPD